MATTRRSSVPKEEPTPSKPRKRSDASAKAGKAMPKGAAPAKKVKQPAKVTKARAPKPTKTATQAVAAAASGLPGTSTATTDPATGLLDTELIFANAYLLEPNGTRAYKAAHPHVKDATAATEAWKLLRKPKIAAFIAAERAKDAAKLKIKRETLLQEAWHVATADARELTEWRINCCRFCYGEGYRYQRTAGEMERDREAHAEAVRKAEEGKAPGPFDEKGGIGWNPHLDPNMDCPECFGDGQGRHVLKDTSKLSPAAVSLYAGVKVTKDGLQVLTHSKQDASEKLFKHLGLYERDNEQKSKGFAQAVAEFADGLRARGAGRLPMAPPKQGGDKA